MKQITLKKMSEAIEKMMLAKNVTPKELAQKAKMSYSSLMPILNGSRECGISKLIAIADALGCTPDSILDGLFMGQPNIVHENHPKPKYFAVFISIIRVTYCMLYEVKTKKSASAVLQFPLRCGEASDDFLEYILSTIDKLSKELKKEVIIKEVAVFASVQQYGRSRSRKKIQTKGDYLFPIFIMEPDAITNHKTFIGKNNGICITINDGSVITYSFDFGKTIKKLEGYGFPLTDVAGNWWIGCEAIRHALNVKLERESSSVISDRLLAVFHGDIDYLAECTTEDPAGTYVKASAIVKEFILSHEEKSNQIIKNSAQLLMDEIGRVDKEVGVKLPIFIAGELAYIYEAFFPQERMIKIEQKQSDALLAYGVSKLKANVETLNEKM